MKEIAEIFCIGSEIDLKVVEQCDMSFLHDFDDSMKGFENALRIGARIKGMVRSDIIHGKYETLRASASPSESVSSLTRHRIDMEMKEYIFEVAMALKWAVKEDINHGTK